jgi:hypothetical protein
MPPEPISSLASLNYVPYLDAEGYLPGQFERKVGTYAIFDQDKTLQFIGYSRDIYLSLKQHLVRQPRSCYWLKVQTIDRPSRTALETIKTTWIAENGSTPAGNGTQSKWDQPIDVKAAMTPEEYANYTDPLKDEQAQRKTLKNAARRIEAEILAELESRHVQEAIRFNPKLKDSGLLDLK